MHVAGLCNGSTADSDSVCLGSNPSPAATKPPKSLDFQVLSGGFAFSASEKAERRMAPLL